MNKRLAATRILLVLRVSVSDTLWTGLPTRTLGRS